MKGGENVLYSQISFRIDYNWMYAPDLFHTSTTLSKLEFSSEIESNFVYIYTSKEIFPFKKEISNSTMRIISNTEESNANITIVFLRNAPNENRVDYILCNQEIILRINPFEITFISDNGSLNDDLEKFIDSGNFEIKNISSYSSIKNHNFRKYKLYLIEESIIGEIPLPNPLRNDNIFIITTKSEESHINGCYQININNIEHRERFKNLANSYMKKFYRHYIKAKDYIEFFQSFQYHDKIPDDLNFKRKYEGYFQFFFNHHPDFFSRILDINGLVFAEAPVNFSSIEGTGANRVDYICVDENKSLLIEIKTPETSCIGIKSNRNGICKIRTDFASACVQIKYYFEEFSKNRQILEMKGSISIPSSPKPILIIGDQSKLNDLQKKTFDLFRELMNQSIEIYCFDELFKKYIDKSF
jgi:hypothetical protein